MTSTERSRRHRYLQGWIAAQLKRWKKKHRRGPQVHNWNRNAPPDILGRELAYSCFDWQTKMIDRERWDEIDRNVRKSFNEIEREYAGFVADW